MPSSPSCGLRLACALCSGTWFSGARWLAICRKITFCVGKISSDGRFLSRFLCTTALEERWPLDRPVLFLGEWCRLHSRRERWSRMAAEVMPYHWDDRAKYQADYHCLLEVHVCVLSELAGKLNRIHGVAHEVRYWRILLGPWLGLFVQMVFDRWACIERSVLEYGASETIVLSGSEEAFVPNDTADFHQLFLADEWNHHIYSSI